MFKIYNKILFFYLIILIFLCIFFVPILYSKSNFYKDDSDYEGKITISSNLFIWPIPGYTTISSYFGKRNSPTARSF